MKRAFVTTILSALAIALATAASGQEGGFRGSFITPFPANDVYQVQVMGDWLADGLLNGMLEPTASGARVNGGIRVGCLDRFPQRAIAIGVKFVVGGVYGDSRGVGHWHRPCNQRGQRQQANNEGA